jgi:predicted deacylase
MEQTITEHKRLIGEFKNSPSSPTLIVIGGVHGNEPAGVQALEQVVAELNKSAGNLAGNFYAIAGNLQALREGKRYLSRDLNRIWTGDTTRLVENGLEEADYVDPEMREHYELYYCLKEILDSNEGPFYFIDLHTVSSESAPFMIINDMLINRELATKLPVPIILGIEEYVDGSLLSRVNKLGYVGIGFESGMHDDPASVTKHESFIWLMLKHTGCLSPDFDLDVEKHNEILRSEYEHGFFELKYRHKIEFEEAFQMNPGFVNFQPVAAGEPLAINEKGPIEAPRSGRIFMPLYQSSGEDGFFIIRKVPRFALSLSRWLRKVNFEAMLTLMPGIRRDPVKHYQLIVNLSVAKFLAKDLFHLLGYRQREKAGDYLLFTRREFDVRAKR